MRHVIANEPADESNNRRNEDHNSLGHLIAIRFCTGRMTSFRANNPAQTELAEPPVLDSSHDRMRRAYDIGRAHEQRVDTLGAEPPCQITLQPLQHALTIRDSLCRTRRVLPLNQRAYIELPGCVPRDRFTGSSAGGLTCEKLERELAIDYHGSRQRDCADNIADNIADNASQVIAYGIASAVQAYRRVLLTALKLLQRVVIGGRTLEPAPLMTL
jgi:hypothetical protein